MKNRIVSKTISVLLASLLMVSTCFADTGTGADDTGMGNSTLGYTISNPTSGVKISILKVAMTTTNGEVVSAYENGYMMGYTPTSASAGIQQIDNKKGGASVYILNKSSSTIEATPTGNTSNPIATQDISQYIIGGTGSNYTSDSTVAPILSNIISKFKINWDVGTVDIEGQLGLVNARNMVDGPAKEQAIAKNKLIFRGIGSMVSYKYPSSGVAKKLADDGVAIDTDEEYIFLIEPVYSYKINGKETLITMNNMARTYTLTSGNDIVNDDNWKTTLANVNSSNLQKTWGVKGFGNVKGVSLGVSANPNSFPDGNGGQCFASKIFYNGPKSYNKDTNVTTLATKSDMKIGYGLLRPADYLFANASIGTLFGSFSITDDGAGASKVSSPKASALYSQLDLNTIMKNIDESSLPGSSTLLRSVSTLSKLVDTSKVTATQIKNMDVPAVATLLSGLYVKKPSYRAVYEAIREKGYDQSEIVKNFGLATIMEELYQQGSSFGIKNPTVQELQGQGTKTKPTEVGINGSKEDTIVISPDLAKVYADTDKVVPITLGVLNVKIPKPITVYQNGLAYLCNSAVREALDNVSSQFSSTSGNLGSNAPFSVLKDSTLIYGKSDTASSTDFYSYTVNHDIISYLVVANLGNAFRNPNTATGYPAEILPNATYQDLIVGGVSGDIDTTVPGMDFSVTNKTVYNDKIESVLTIMGTVADTSADINNILYKASLAYESQSKLVVKPGTAPNTEIISGNSYFTYSVIDKAVPLGIQFIQIKDGQPKVVTVEGKNYLDIGGVSAFGVGKNVPISTSYTLDDGSLMKATNITVKSSKTDTTSFNQQLVSDLQAKSPVTIGNGFSVPVLKVAETEKVKTIKISARDTDIGATTPILVTVVLEEINAPQVVETYTNIDGTHIKTDVSFAKFDADGKLQIVDKPSEQAKVDSWFTSTELPTTIVADTPWSSINTTPYVGTLGSLTGNGPGTVSTNYLPDPKVIYIHYLVDDIPPTGSGASEAQYISFQKTLDDLKLTPWDIATSISWDVAFGTHTYYHSSGYHGYTGTGKNQVAISCDGHTCSLSSYTDSSYSLVEEISQPKAELVAPGTDYSSIYKFIYGNNKKSGSVEPTPKFENLAVQAVLHRGLDRVTVAKYKSSSNGSATSDLAIIGYKTDNLPTPSQRKNADYQDKSTYSWSVRNPNEQSPDYIVKATCTDGETHTGELKGSSSRDFTFDISVYRDKVNKGLDKANSVTVSQTTMNNKVIKNVAGQAYHGAVVDYYPYVKMLYETSTQKKIPVYVLSDEKSYYQVNDYIEVGWNKLTTENMNITSSQFTTHKAATNGSEGWKKKDMVLPGGAIFGVTSTSRTDVGLRTYTTYIPSDILTTLNGAYPTLDPLRAADAITVHTTALNKLKSELDKLQVQMLVNKNWNANVLTDGNSIVASKDTTSSDLAKLGIPQTKLSQDNKYWLQKDASGTSTKNTESDFDVTNVVTENRYLKVRSDVDGNVIIEASTDGINWSLKGKWSATAGVGAIVAALPTEFKEANDRTKFVTNFVNSISRTGGWYNEAWDGICVLVQTSTMEFGLIQPQTRMATLDTKLTPKHDSVSKIYSAAFGFAFRTENKTVTIPFKGSVSVNLPKVTDMQVSSKRYIPNATTQDLDGR